MTQHRFGLASLLSGTGVTDLTDFDPHVRYVSNGALERLPDLLAIPELRSPDALGRTWRFTKITALPSKPMNTRTKISLEPQQVNSALECGFTLYFDRIQNQVPALRPLLNSLERDLGLPAGEINCAAFASKTGTGAKMHFDNHLTFNLQIIGRKKWIIGKNRSVAYPPAGWSIEQKKNALLLPLIREELPIVMPNDAEAFETGPGATVYIPHGDWHATEALDFSFALVFAIEKGSWANRFLKIMENALLYREDKWRKIPMGLKRPEFWNENGKEVSGFLEDFKTLVGQFDLGLLRELIGGPSAYYYKLSDGVRVNSGSNQSVSGAASQDASRGLAEILDWISSRNRVFTSDELSEGLPHLDSDFVVAALKQFTQSGILKRLDTPSGR